MDFTQKKYKQFCKTVAESDYRTITFAGFLKLENVDLNSNLLILRHDVDDRPKFALDMAKIELENGLIGTYYFRYPQGWNDGIMKEIAAMGHEIGYHYQCLDAAKGDMQKAIEIFKKELERFRKVAIIETAAMHGNPLTKWDNRDIWQHCQPKDFGLIGETYLSMDFTKALYYTDTGRTWEDKLSLKDNIPKGQKSAANKPVIKTTDDFMQLIQTEKRNLYINTHPDRWSDTWAYWIAFWAFDVAVNIIKTILIKAKK